MSTHLHVYDIEKIEIWPDNGGGVELFLNGNLSHSVFLTLRGGNDRTRDQLKSIARAVEGVLAHGEALPEGGGGEDSRTDEEMAFQYEIEAAKGD